MTSDGALIAFGERLLAVLDRGSFTSTYKYAVLLGLIDLVQEKNGPDGAAPTSVTTRELAEQVVTLYWPHTRAYPATRGVLGQNLPQRGKRGQAEVVAMIAAFRAQDPTRSSVERARQRHAEAWARLVREVEWKLVEMPLPRLQTVGRLVAPFLYQISWDTSVRRRPWRAGKVDNLIRFLPGAAEALVRLAPLLRTLIEREWSALIAAFNGLPIDELERFLFGVDRASLAPLRAPIVELHGGCCFYCGRAVRERDAQLDHFVPWARQPNNAVENLVAAHARCNGAKSDHLAAAEHLERWLERLEGEGGSMRAIGAATGCLVAPERSVAIARGIYVRLPEQTALWRAPGVFEGASPGRIAAVFAGRGGGGGSNG